MNAARPGEPEHFVFDAALRIVRAVVPAAAREFFVKCLLGVTPDVPVSLRGFPPDSSAPRAFWSGATLALVFCLGGSAIAALLGHTFAGTDPQRIYFVHDYPNLINYGIICPLYVGLALAFVVLVLQTWQRLYITDANWTQRLVGRRRLRVATMAFIVLSAAALVTTIYVKECMDPSVYRKVGWYMETTQDASVRTIGLVGVYYALLNFSLLIVSLVGLVFVFPYMAIAADIARLVRATDARSTWEFGQLRRSLTEFTQAYIVVKLLAAALMFNAYTWKWEKPDGSLTFVMLAGVLSLFGVFLVSLPRYYIELEWYYFETRRACANNGEMPHHSADLRTLGMRLLAWALDTIFGIGFVWSIWR